MNPIRRKMVTPLLIASLAMLSDIGPAAASDELWARLKEGGKVVLMRHAKTVKGKGLGNPLFRDPTCKKERNLSNEGKRDAETVGNQFRQRGIPVSEVRHSPFCRTTDTAKHAFGNVAPAEYLSLLEILEPDAATRQTRKLTEVIGSYTGTGNLVLVSHEPNIGAVSFEEVSNLDFVVLQPKGGNEYEELGKIRFVDQD
jgi:phosphohistidine phosphatase SixA